MPIDQFSVLKAIQLLSYEVYTQFTVAACVLAPIITKINESLRLLLKEQPSTSSRRQSRLSFPDHYTFGRLKLAFQGLAVTNLWKGRCDGFPSVPWYHMDTVSACGIQTLILYQYKNMLSYYAWSLVIYYDHTYMLTHELVLCVCDVPSFTHPASTPSYTDRANLVPCRKSYPIAGRWVMGIHTSVIIDIGTFSTNVCFCTDFWVVIECYFSSYATSGHTLWKWHIVYLLYLCFFI